MEKTACHHIIADSSTKALIADVRAELEGKNHATQTTEPPGLFDAFPSLAPGSKQNEHEPYEPYPYSDARPDEEVVIILHSSGSTGFPKPIPLSQQYLYPVIRSRKWTIIMSVARLNSRVP